MFIGLVIGLASLAEIVMASRSGELSRFLFEGGSPWLVVALVASFLVVFSAAAPRIAAPAASLGCAGFMWAAVGPDAVHSVSSFLPMAVLAAACAAGACVALTRPRLTRRPVSKISSRQVRALLRARA